jgi:hypothetical protein
MRTEAYVEPTSVESLAAPVHSSLRELQAYWLSKKGDLAAPARAAIDPSEIKSLLPSLLLIDVVDDVASPQRFRIRLFGTGLVDAYGEEITGKFGDEIDLDDVVNELTAFLDTAVRECRPQYLRTEYTKVRGRHLKYEQIILPLSDDGKKVNMLLCSFHVDKAFELKGMN